MGLYTAAFWCVAQAWAGRGPEGLWETEAHCTLGSAVVFPRHHHPWGVAALWCSKCDLSRQGGELATCLSQKWGGMSLEQPQLVLSEFGGSGKVSAHSVSLNARLFHWGHWVEASLISACICLSSGVILQVSGHILFLTWVLVRRVLHSSSLNSALVFHRHFCIYTH